jgi:hypothetical protein
MERPENEPQVLLSEPWTGRWEQLRDGVATALAALLVDLGLGRAVFAMGPRYEEVVTPDELPTDDLSWSVRRDVEERGQVVVTVYHDPERTTFDEEGIDGIEQVFAGVLDRGEGPRLTVLRFSTEMLRQSIRVAREITRGAG